MKNTIRTIALIIPFFIVLHTVKAQSETEIEVPLVENNLNTGKEKITVFSIPHPDLTPSDIGIKIFNDIKLHPTSSYILGTVRNHVEQPWKGSSILKDYKPILKKYGEIKPIFGEQKKMYRLGHGITDGREDFDYINGYHFEAHWNSKGPYPYDDIRIGLSEAKLANSETIMVVNYGSADAEEAGKLLGFLNKKESSLRTTYPNNEGNDAPWNVKYFEIGNEITWDQETGHDKYAKTPEQYATRAKTFATKMRENSDIPIKIGLVGATNSNWTATGWKNGPDKNTKRVPYLNPLIDIMGTDLDFIIFHNYSKWPFNELDNLQSMSQAQFSRDLINEWVIPTISEAEIRNNLTPNSIKLANTEFHSENGNWQDVRKMGETVEFLYSAGEIINAITIERLTIALNFCLSHEGVTVDNLFFYDFSDPNKPTGVYQLQKMVAENLGNTVVKAQGYNLPIHTYVAGFTENGSNSLDMFGYQGGTFQLEKLAFAVTKHDNETVTLLVLNKMENDDITIPIDPGFDVGSATIQTIKGESYTDTSYQLETIDLTNLNNVTFPRTSVSIITIVPSVLSDNTSDLDEMITIYPNPTSGLITLEVDNPINSIIIYDLLGKIIYSNKNGLKEYDISELANGIYILKIEDNEGNIYSKKIKKK